MRNLRELLENTANKAPKKGIIVVNYNQNDIFMPYSKLLNKSKRIAFVLQSIYQMEPKDKIIVSVEKSEDFILLFWGCIMAGCIPVLMPSVHLNNKSSIASERLENAIKILDRITLVTNDINLFEHYKSSVHKAVYFESDLYSRLSPLFDLGFDRRVFRPGYGLAETTLIVSSCCPGYGGKTIKIDRQLFYKDIVKEADKERDSCEFVSAGRVLPGIQVRIMKDDIPQDSLNLGEIQVKGACVMSGYYNDVQSTKNVLRDGWLSTGDLGFFDRDKILYIVGRKKEIIIVNGQNFHPFDLENCVLGKFGLLMEKSVFTSFYSTTEGREVALHFFVLSRKMTEEQTRQLINECNTFLADKVGFVPEYSIEVKKGEILRTSSSKIKRRFMARCFEQGKYDKSIVKFKKECGSTDYSQILHEIWRGVLKTSFILPQDNFFSLGGDSIRSMMAVSEIEERLNVKLENSFFYKYPSLTSQTQFLEEFFSKNIQPPANELEPLVREFISEETGIPPSEIQYTDNIIAKTTSFAILYQMMRRLTEVFDRVALDDIKDKTCVRDIARVIKERYEIPPGHSFPLMDFQETLFYHSKGFIRNEPTGLSCYIISRARLKGYFDLACWDKAMNHLIACHPLLHSVLSEESDRPEMKVLPRYPAFKTSYEDISSMSKQEQELFLLKKDEEDHDYRFELDKYPLFYWHIYKTGEDEHEITIHIDHQAIDGFSFFRFLQEQTCTYDQLADGKAVTVKKEKGLLFSDYVFVEKWRSRTRRYRNAMDFALNVFKNLPPKTAIPMKRQPSLAGDVHFRTLHTESDPSLMEKVLEISNHTPGICLNSLLMACYFKLMNLWSGQNDLIINMPVFNREQHLPNAKNILGSFLDIFPVRIQTSPRESVVSIARKIEQFVRVMLEYPISSIELSRRIAEQEGLKQSSLSGIIFSNSIHMLPKGVSRSSRYLTIGAPKVQTGAPGTYIDLVMYTWEDKWCFDWNYVRELFDPPFIRLLSGQFESILNQLTDEADGRKCEERPCSDILPLSYVKLLEETNKTGRAYPVKTIHEQIRSIVDSYPDREAISCRETSLSYAEFWERANQAAHFLRSVGVARNSKVVLLLNRSLDLPIAQLGILLAGGAYVPIDPSYPSDRIQYMISDCGAEVLITQGIHAENINRSYALNIRHCVLLEDDAIPLPDTYQRHTADDIRKHPASDIAPCNGPEDLIYIIYTSGSTGQPKGTMLSHKNVSNFLNYGKEAFNVSRDNRFALITSYSFDMTVTSNWLPFITGASLHILSDIETRNTENLLHFIDEKRIDFLNVTPSHFSMLANTLEFLESPVNLSADMTILLGAEVVNVPDINRWLESYPSHKFVNEYGPTETTVASTFYPVPAGADGKCLLDIIPIGKPIYNTQVYVLNDNLDYALPEVPGILYIGGEGVSCGYLNKEEKTKSVFITNPITHQGVVYNTGDVVKMTLTGDIVFVGRKDFQVNVRGYRIELGEIEAALLKVPGITESCAEIQYDINKQPVVVAFYVAANNADLEHTDIISALKMKIPHYMLPSAMAKIERIPISANGKADKKRLPDIANLKQNLARRDFVSPRNEKEKQAARIWEKVLGLSDIGIHDNFWEIGGDSIRSVRLIKELKEAGLADVKLKDLFDKPTIAGLTGQKAEKSKVGNLIGMRKVSAPCAKLICLPYAAGTPGMYTAFAGDLAGNIELYTMQYPGHGDGRELKSSVEEVSELLADDLKGSGRDVPLFVMGYSYGCYVAYDICKRFEQENIPIRGIIMVGATPPTLRDDLMRFFSNDDSAILDCSRSKDLLNEEFIATLSKEEKHEYLHELRINTVAMVNYEFLDFKLKTSLCSIVGREDEPAIRNNQRLWNDYFQKVSFHELPGGHVLINKHHAELAKLITDYIESHV